MKRVSPCWALALACFLYFLPLALQANSGGTQITETIANRSWQGIPGLERTARGRVFASWFTGGPKEPAPENTVLLSWSDDGAKTFTLPQAMGEPKDGTRCYDPTVWIDPKGRLWYIFNRGNKDTAQHDIWARICDQPDAQTPVFGQEFRVGYDVPFAFRMNKVTVLSSGEWLMPVTLAQKPIPAWSTGYNDQQEPTLHGVGISGDEGRTWTLHGAVKSRPWALENMIVELKDGRLWMLIRTSSGVLWESHSSDKGRTWSEGRASSIPSPGSRFFIRRLTSGNLLLVNHFNFKRRNNLTALVSTDDGATWRGGLLLDERVEVSYPDGVQDKDGLIWITYDRDRQGEGDILLAKFKEQDALAGTNVSGAVSLKQVINRIESPKLVPAGWNAALAGDMVMQRLHRVTAPHVKGAHDAEFVCIGGRAYIVEHDNDIQPGHGAGKAEYCVLSIVDLKTQAVEKVIPLAKSEEVFENETLLVGACFVPRILQKDASTLRCYFASEDGNKREAQMWYRDFDLKTESFEKRIHKAKLKTAAGVFDMQPRYFHADAAALGFNKPAQKHGLYIFDSFKQFDGTRYIALNNFPGKQNALAILHDDFETFEIVGHYNEPQDAQLSESAVNRLPDGSWMAICRNDLGNYHFTTSKDGKQWTAGRELPFVSGGLNSKPIFEKFGDAYYLGWQENTKIGGSNRSVFNIDVSRDGKRWERKYRFETPESFQYPSLHEYEGVVWLVVTQSDHGGTTDRIMFGKLEESGRFETQSGKQRITWPAPAEEPAVMRKGVRLFADRDYTLTEAPEFLLGRSFLRTSIGGYELDCTKPGELFVMTLSKPHEANQSAALEKAGFVKVGPPEFQLFPGEINRVSTWRRHLNPGDRVAFKKLAFAVFGEGLGVKLRSGSEQKPESPEQRAARILEMEKVAESALVPPVLNTSPLPRYDYENLDYGMTIGIERTPGGRLWACWVAGGDSPQAYFVLATSDDDGQTWSKPRLVVDSHSKDLPRERSILVGNLWTDPLGKLWLIFDQSMDMFDGRAGVWATVCENPDADSPAWSAPKRIWHGVTLNKPTVLSNGEWMLPVSLDQRGGFGAFKGCFSELDPVRGANVFVSANQGKSWERRGVATFPNPDWQEHMIVERKNGSLWMLARTGKGIMESVSTDGGRNWTEAAVPEGMRQPNARFFVRRLLSGRLLFVKHGDQIDSHQGRVQLSAWLSDDDGKTWQGGLVLDERKGITYPDGFQAPDGTIYISYDRNRSPDGEILLARFTEADVLAKQLTGPKSKLKMLISRPLARFTKPESEFSPIFDGKTFSGWEQSGNWSVEDGAFYRKSAGGSLKYTAATVPDDFELRFEWKVSQGCNSGVYYRPGQVEYQVLDNRGSAYGENARQSAASLFFCMAPSKDATRPVGEWNTARILCKGTVIEHWLNGERVLSFDYADAKWEWYVQLLAARGGDLTGRRGQISLQDHGQDVWFKNLRWREIPKGEVVVAEPYFEPLQVSGAALEKENARVKAMLEAKEKQKKP